MNEIIKAKRKDNGEWIKGYYCPKKPYCYDNRTIPKHVIITEFSTTGIVYFEIDEKTICHPSGQKDKNGDEIWEHDLCFINDGTLDEEDGLFEVVWETNTSSFVLEGTSLVCDFDNVFGYECDVVGNTFDNPEFTKGEYEYDSE